MCAKMKTRHETVNSNLIYFMEALRKRIDQQRMPRSRLIKLTHAAIKQKQKKTFYNYCLCLLLKCNAQYILCICIIQITVVSWMFCHELKSNLNLNFIQISNTRKFRNAHKPKIVWYSPFLSKEFRFNIDSAVASIQQTLFILLRRKKRPYQK